MKNVGLIVFLMLLSYSIGCISPSSIMAKMNGIDIKKEGSGNAGTTNALRVLGKKAAAVTFFVDVFKGFIAVFIAQRFLSPEIACYAAMAVFFGHVFPLHLKFKGGKGVATGFGASLAICPWIGLTAFAVFIVTVVISKMVSPGSILAAVVFLVVTWFCADYFMIPASIMVATVMIKHRSNIQRLIRGEENKINLHKK